TWGGRSVIGNTTTGNEITVTSGTHTDVYGGWTRGASSQTATADKGNSTDNKVTVDGTATVNGNVYGGMTTVEDGTASHNVVTINKGVTLNGHGYVYGGSTDDGSSADNNKVYLNGIRIPGTVYGGTAANGTANGNGKWDTGDYDTKKQPEEVYYYPYDFQLRQMWDAEEYWHYKEIPILEQKPQALKKEVNNKKQN
ncbi:MAG: hypothetical protein ACFNYM_00880, partial [Bacteroidota bacterium]